MFTLGHEFGHYIVDLSNIEISFSAAPHDGYVNPNSAGAISEGLAHFFGGAALLEITNKEPKLPPELYVLGGNIEKNYRPPGIQLTAPRNPCIYYHVSASEEYAVYSLLWDLYDGINNSLDDQDNVKLDLGLLWNTINSLPPLRRRDGSRWLCSTIRIGASRNGKKRSARQRVHSFKLNYDDD